MPSILIAAAALAATAAPAAPAPGITLPPAYSASESPCRGPEAKPGETVSGVVLHVEDGDTLCLAKGASPDQWTRIRINTVYVHEADAEESAWAKAGLMSVAFGRKLDCPVRLNRSGEAVADCRAGDVKLTRLMSEPGARAQAARWYRAPDGSSPVLRIASR